jgi:endonuclease YncB( thermonuclease family)
MDDEIIKKLENLNDKDLPFFNFHNIKTKAKIIDIYDGDTITIIFYHNNSFIKYKARLIGYDSPEMKPLKTIENRDLHKKCAIMVKEILCNKILNKIVDIEFQEEDDKYGRLLCKIYYENECINDYMIKNGFGKTYDGNKKSIFTLEDLNKIQSFKS